MRAAGGAPLAPAVGGPGEARPAPVVAEASRLDLLLVAPERAVLERLWPALAQLGVRRLILADAVRGAGGAARRAGGGGSCAELLEQLRRGGVGAAEPPRRAPEVRLAGELELFLQRGSLDAAAGSASSVVRLFCHPGDRARRVSSAVAAARAEGWPSGALLAVGPEEGWRASEVELLRRHRFAQVSPAAGLSTDMAVVAMCALATDALGHEGHSWDGKSCSSTCDTADAAARHRFADPLSLSGVSIGSAGSSRGRRPEAPDGHEEPRPTPAAELPDFDLVRVPMALPPQCSSDFDLVQVEPSSLLHFGSAADAAGPGPPLAPPSPPVQERRALPMLGSALAAQRRLLPVERDRSTSASSASLEGAAPPPRAAHRSPPRSLGVASPLRWPPA